MTPKSYRGLERDIDAMVAAVAGVCSAENSEARTAATKRVREHRDAVFARVKRMEKNAWQRGGREARKVQP